MKSQKPRKRKKRTLLWIVLIAVVLLAGAFGLYTQLDLNRPVPVARPAVARGKIPPMAPAPATMPIELPSSQSENVRSETLPAAAEAVQGSADAAAASSRPAIPASEPVVPATEVRQKIDNRIEPENTPTAPPASSAPGQTDMPESAPSGSAAAQEPGAGISGSQLPVDMHDSQTVASLSPDDRPAADPVAQQPSPAQQVVSEPAPSTLPKKAKPQQDPEPPAPFSVQVGAYLTKAYADEMAVRLMEKGYNAYILQRTDKKKRVWHLVRFGHFQERKAAAQAMKSFKDQEHMDASVALSNAI